MSSSPRIRTHQLCRYYESARQTVRAVDQVNISIEKGDFLAITGASGSGKSTLVNLLAGLDTPTSGYIEVDNHRLDEHTRRELAAYRARKMGVVFQSFNLLPHHSALRNVEMALYFDGTPRPKRRGYAVDALERVGLGDRLHHRPVDLSGGEQQRVAIARAFVSRPEILFADEPTGNLDQENSDEIARILTELNKDGMTVVLVTHDVDTANRLVRRVVRMDYGRIADETGHSSKEK